MLRTLSLSFAALAIFGQGASFSAQISPAEAARKIDAILQADWKKHNLKGNPDSTDQVFVRRVYLDIIGRIPTTREADAFLNSKDPAKRAKLIDKLLGSEAYVQHFYNYWADVLRLTTNGNQTGGITGAAYADFIKQSLRKNKPYDKFVGEMVAAQGKAWDNGAIGYYMRDRGMPLDNFANTARVFLGTRIECAQCHNHPFDKWTQMQFHQMAAFTYGVETQDYYGGVMGGVRELLSEKEKAARESVKYPQRPQRPNINGKMTKEERAAAEKKFAKEMKDYEAKMTAANKQRNEVSDKVRKEQRSYNEAMNDIRDTMRYTSVSTRDRKLTLPHDYQYTDAKPKSAVQPVTMMGHAAEPKEGETHLDAYARWMTSPDNPRFTTVIANRMWKKAFGLALYEPLDELMDASVPMNAELAKHLEQLVKDTGYDMKAYLRAIFNTRAYQAAATKEEIPAGVVYHFTGPVLRRMTAEQMWDSFVTLINPNPDMVNQASRDAMEQRILQAKKIADGLETLSPDEALNGLKKAAEVYSRNRTATDKQQNLFVDARRVAKEAEDKAKAMPEGPQRDAALAKAKELKNKADSIRSEVNRLQNEGRRVTHAQVITTGQKKLFEKVTGKPYQTVALNTKDGAGAPPAMTGGDMMMMASSGRTERVVIPGYDRPELTKEEREAVNSKIRESFDEEADFYGIPADPKVRRYYYNARENVNRTWLRAAELESPAPRGHYLREFGQSDRETIENANYDASVPQALSLMNSQLLPSIMDRNSQLMLGINKAPYPDEKVDAACMALFSRKATPAEKAAWLKAQDKGLTGMEDLIYALINTQQFIFIQ